MSADQKLESGKPLSEYEENLGFAAKQTLEFVKAIRSLVVNLYPISVLIQNELLYKL